MKALSDQPFLFRIALASSEPIHLKDFLHKKLSEREKVRARRVKGQRSNTALLAEWTGFKACVQEKQRRQEVRCWTEER